MSNRSNWIYLNISRNTTDYYQVVMIVVYQNHKRNTFGGITYEFKIGNYFKVKIHEANNQSYLFELLEPNWIIYKKVNTFISYKGLDESVSEAIDNIYIYLLSRKEFNYPYEFKEEDKNEVIYQLRRLSQVR